MKTLIFFGSPRPEGGTAYLTRLLREELRGETFTVDAYRADISPCVDCRYCRAHPGCAIKDGMEKVYRYLEDCDCAVIASPIYFSTLTGKLLDTAGRLQTLFSAGFFRGEKPSLRPKRGGVILTGGGSGGGDRAVYTARLLLSHMNCSEIYPAVCSLRTDTVPAKEDKSAAEEIKKLACFLNGR